MEINYMQVSGCYYIKGAELHSVEHVISYSYTLQVYSIRYIIIIL